MKAGGLGRVTGADDAADDGVTSRGTTAAGEPPPWHADSSRAAASEAGIQGRTRMTQPHGG